MEIFLQTVESINDESRVVILNFIDDHKEVCICDIENSFERTQFGVSRH